jgi:methionyl-tRNA formyltransferase
MRLIFAGTPEIAAQALERLSEHHEIALVITREDAPVGRKKTITPSAVAQAASRLGLDVLKTSRVAVHLEQIRAVDAELAVVVAYGALLPPAALELLPWWNLHFSLLPAWRGATPLQHSMIFGFGSGISIFEIERGLDTGDLIATKPMDFLPGETSLEALPRFTEAGVELLLSQLESVPKPQKQIGEPTLAPKISRLEAKVDFEKTSDEVARFINALNPEPTAWANIAGQPIKLLRAKSLGQVDWLGLDGQGEPRKIWVSENRVLVGCGRGTRIELLELQPAGKKAMSALDFMRGQQQEVFFD